MRDWFTSVLLFGLAAIWLWLSVELLISERIVLFEPYSAVAALEAVMAGGIVALAIGNIINLHRRG